MKSAFMGLISRMRFIKRWGLMRGETETLVEHSFDTATIAYMLSVIGRVEFRSTVDPRQVATAALFHDCHEVVTGDIATPVKHFNDRLLNTFRALEREAEDALLDSLPVQYRSHFEDLVRNQNSVAVNRYIKAADVLSAFLKAKSEVDRGNHDFSDALTSIHERLNRIEMPEVQRFIDIFVDAYGQPLDRLLKREEHCEESAEMCLV